MVEQGTHKPLVGGSNPPSATSSLDALADRLLTGMRRLNVASDASLVLAVSGGGDSIALLHAAAHLRQTDAVAWSLSVAHLDHALRADSADDAEFVAATADRLGIGCTIGRTDVAALARTEHRSVEEAGRLARYRFLEEVAAPATLIVTAHTADDAAETMLINLLRGSGLAGIRGIPERRGRVIRPLLGERRETLRQLLQGAGIAYRDDESNEDPAFLRNRVRAELLPLLERLRPGAVEMLLRHAELSGADNALLDELADDELRRRRRADGRIDWREPPARALGRRIIRLAVGHGLPTAERVEALLEAAEGNRGSVRIELGGGRVASVRERHIRVE